MNQEQKTDALHIQQTGVRSPLHSLAYSTWLKLGFAVWLKRRRVRVLEQCLAIDFNQLGQDGRRLRICEVGCGSGRDFIRHLANSPNEVWGIDRLDAGIRQENFRFMHRDAGEIPVEDGYFDGLVSIGMLEHVEPIEHLCEVIREMTRVAKRYAVIVPSINTLLEPHTQAIRWQLRAVEKLDALNYFSDMAWLKFRGFEGAKTMRFDYLPGVITNLVIYGGRPG